MVAEAKTMIDENLNNASREANAHFRNKWRGNLNGKINTLEANSEKKNLRRVTDG
jgi:hypothetical protein